jgi:hypothetical protein
MNNDFKGTKGKWVLRTFPEGQMSVRNESDTRKICVPRVQNYEESLANLLLISKAPEMLEMLKNINKSLSMTKLHTSLINKEEIKQLIKEATEL